MVWASKIAVCQRHYLLAVPTQHLAHSINKLSRMGVNEEMIAFKHPHFTPAPSHFAPRMKLGLGNFVIRRAAENRNRTIQRFIIGTVRICFVELKIRPNQGQYQLQQFLVLENLSRSSV